MISKEARCYHNGRRLQKRPPLVSCKIGRSFFVNSSDQKYGNYDTLEDAYEDLCSSVGGYIYYDYDYSISKRGFYL